MPSENMSLCISYVPGIFDMERSKDFDDHGVGLIHRCGAWGQAIGNVTHFGWVAILLCSRSENVHRERQRLTTNERCHREQDKPTENLQKWESL